MEVGHIRRTATTQIMPSIDLEEEAEDESATVAASRPDGELVAAIGPGTTPTIFDHMQSTMRGSDLLSQFPQGERKRHRRVCRTRFLNSQAGPSPSEPAAQGNGSSRPGRMYPKSGAPANKPWVQPAPTAPKSLPSLAATPSAKVEPGTAGKSAMLPPAALVSGTAYTASGEPVAQVLYSQTSLSDMASKFDMVECVVVFREGSYPCILDTGSSLNLISWSCVCKFQLAHTMLPTKLKFKVANGELAKAKGEL